MLKYFSVNVVRLQKDESHVRLNCRGPDRIHNDIVRFIIIMFYRSHFIPFVYVEYASDRIAIHLSLWRVVVVFF